MLEVYIYIYKRVGKLAFGHLKGLFEITGTDAAIIVDV